LLEQKQRIETVEARKRTREMKKYGKQVQAEKQQAAAKQKSAEQEKIKQWKGMSLSLSSSTPLAVLHLLIDILLQTRALATTAWTMTNSRLLLLKMTPAKLLIDPN
jgi:coproporphyrinogen III oxidase-like Fe-S oxidoreductase